MTYTKALVTGGSGFIGSHLVDALVERGVAVTVIDKAEPKPNVRNAKANYVIRDIRDDGLNEVVVSASPEVVFHLAAHIDDRASVNDPAMDASHNVIGALRVFEAAKQAKVKKILFASSCAVYGYSDKAVRTEKMTPQPATPYAISKFTGEKYLAFYHRLHSIPFVAFRIGNVYGPRQDGSKESGAIAIFTSKLVKGEAPFMNDDGQTTRDYIHVSDVVAAFLAGAEKEVVGVFNCGTNKATATAEVFALIAGLLKSSVTALPRPEVKDSVKHLRLQIREAKNQLGWKPVMRLKKGLRDTVKWYKKQQA